MLYAAEKHMLFMMMSNMIQAMQAADILQGTVENSLSQIVSFVKTATSQKIRCKQDSSGTNLTCISGPYMLISLTTTSSQTAGK